jgi:hypothetical protein
LLFKVTYFHPQNRLSFHPKIASFGPLSHLTQFAKLTHFWYHLNKGAAEPMMNYE